MHNEAMPGKSAPLKTQTTACRKLRRYRAAKRAFDVVSAAAALGLLWPLMLVIGLFIRLDSEGPARFVHMRCGEDGRAFPLLKFRTMCAGAEAMIPHFTPAQRAEWEQNFKLNDDPRITRFGRLLRKTSLDELPQLINVLRGELSIVGPRPVVAAELERYGALRETLLSVPPGLTGYWQAYARSDCSYDQRMAMELYYAGHANFLWDLKIVCATFVRVLRRSGAR